MEMPTEVSTLTALPTADENWEILQVGYSPVNMYVIQNLPALPGRMPELFPIDKGFPVLDQYNIEADLIGYGIMKDELFIRMTPPYGKEGTVVSEVFVDGWIVWPGQTYTWLDPSTEQPRAKLWVAGSSSNGGLHVVLAVKR